MEQATCLLYLSMALVFPFLLLKQLRRRGRGGVRLPPGPWRLPVIGSLHHLIGKPLVHRALADLARSLDAPLMYLELGEVPVVVASSPIAAGEIMRAHDATFASRPAWNTTVRMANADGYGLGLAPYGDLWRQLRRIRVSELLGARRVQSFRRVREEEAARLAAAVAATPPGEPVNVGERVAAVIADSTVRAMIGDRFERREKFFEAVEELNKLTAGFSLGEVFPSSWFVSFIGGGVARRAYASHLKTFELIEHAIRQHEERRAAIVLLRIQREGGLSVPLTMGSIKSLIFDLFGAGSETSATTLQWAMSELMRNPKTMKRAQAELRSVLNGKPKVTEDDLTPIKYLKLVSKETLRLHPSAPLLVPIESRESCKILGYDVPKGTTMFANAWALGRDPKHWKDPEEFKPERFEDSTIDFNGTNFEYIPFGSGRRICPDILFAHSNMELTLAALLYHFDWTLTIGVKLSELDMTEEMGLSVRRKNDLHLHSVVFNYQ
uniref:Cytochrome P450 n=2 Tax=Setaria viridis TaxID=4556 RepID=A0A4U6UDF3_SETVI|nr:hypothetical protein SEVIR_5G084200v2 [Setaria viridis]